MNDEIDTTPGAFIGDTKIAVTALRAKGAKTAEILAALHGVADRHGRGPKGLDGGRMDKAHAAAKGPRDGGSTMLINGLPICRRDGCGKSTYLMSSGRWKGRPSSLCNGCRDAGWSIHQGKVRRFPSQARKGKSAKPVIPPKPERRAEPKPRGERPSAPVDRVHDSTLHVRAVANGFELSRRWTVPEDKFGQVIREAIGAGVHVVFDK